MGHHGGVTGSQLQPTEADTATARVVAEVRCLRSGDPFGRITVIVPSFGAARDLVRALALSGGAVNVAARTASQVVAGLAGPALAPRAPLPFPLLAAAVEKALDESPGALEPVAGEPVTAEAVAQACLRLGTVETGSVVAETPLHAEVLRLAAAAHAATGPAYYPRVEAVAAALERLDELGHVVLAAPLRGTELERRLAAALAARGVRPVPGTDAAELAPAADPGAPGAVTGTHVLHASDADDEVRAVARFVRSRLAAGVPGHRIGVYYPSPDPYLRLLLRAFDEAGIAVYGPGTGGLGRTAAGRSLVRLLRLDGADLPRAGLLSIVAEGALRVDDDEGRTVSSRRLELLTRTRVPVLGGDDWDHLAAAAADPAPPPNGLSEAERSAATALLDLVARVRTGLAAVDAARTWTEAADAVGALLTALFRTGPDLAALRAAVSSLGEMDVVAPALSRDRVVGAVVARLDGLADRVGEEGAGVAVGPLDDAVGRDLDTVCVVGMAEGLLPVLHRPDPLVPEGAVEPMPAERLDERYRVLQLALAAGATHRLCSFPRGSLRGGGDRIPSRWLLPTLARLSGGQVRATSWEAEVAGCPHVTAVDSFVEGVLTPPAVLGADPATPTELRLRRLAADGWAVGPGSPAPLTRAHEMRHDRRTGAFTRFTGNVESVRELLTVLDGPVSPTRLEDWAQSPYLFFLTTVLRVRTLDEPAEALEMDLLDYGTLVHEILEAYVAERIEQGAEPSRERLDAILREKCASAVATAPGLLESLWIRREALLGAELDHWYADDLADAEAGWAPAVTEAAFGRAGTDGGDAVEVRYPVTTSSGGRELLLSGSVDRIDTGGGAQRVTDYKTGRAPAKGDRPSAEDPTLSGTRFQLPLYAAAAEAIAAARGGQARPVSEVRYWYCTEKGGFESIALAVTDELRERVRADVGNLVDAIELGWFPLKGGRGSARDLADLLGGADLDRAWERLSRHEPVRSHPAFAGIAVPDPDATRSEESA